METGQETNAEQRLQELIETDDCDAILRSDGELQLTVAGEQRWAFFGRLQPIQGLEQEERTINGQNAI